MKTTKSIPAASENHDYCGLPWMTVIDIPSFQDQAYKSGGLFPA